MRKMTDKNTLSKKGYIIANLIGAALLTVLVPLLTGCGFTVSLVVFIWMMVMYGCYLTFSLRRNRFSLSVNLLAAAELVVLIGFYRRDLHLVIVLAAVWAVLSAVYITPVMRSSQRRRRRGVSTHQIRWSLLGSRTLFALVMVVALFSLGIFYRPAPIPTQVSADGLGCTAEDCADSLSRLEHSEFDALSHEEKLDVLRDVCRVEFTRLGVGHGFSLVCGEMEDVAFAQYEEASYTITVNEKYFDTSSPYSLLNAMCHESYHAYQYELLRGGDPIDQVTQEELTATLQTYTEELNSYVPPEEDKEKYHAQRYEQDAYAYAEKECVLYLKYFGIT